MANPAQSDINGVYSPFSPCDHILLSMDRCAFETLLSPIRFVFSHYLFVSTACECLLSHNLKVNGHQVCPHRCENTDSPLVCLYWIISLPARLGRRPYFRQAFSIVLAPAISSCVQARVCFHKVCYKRWWDACSWCAVCREAMRNSQNLLPWLLYEKKIGLRCPNMTRLYTGLTSSRDHTRLLINLAPNHLSK